jgi:PASTA domain-containing protein
MVLAAVVLLLPVGLAVGAPGVFGPLNPSFETDANPADRLPDDWISRVALEGVPDPPAPATCPDPPGQRTLCVVGTDSFTPVGGSQIDVQPVDGSKMVRLGGPFTSSGETQQQDRYLLEQTFVVDPASPVLQLNYNAFLFDYSGFDELRFTVRLTDENGAIVSQLVQGGFGASGDTSLKTTGWRSAAIDLSAYANQQVHLAIDSGGTNDDLYGFWAYIDAGVLPTPPVGVPTVVLPPGVDVNIQTDPLSGQTWLTIPRSQQSQCTEVTISVPINPGSGVVSNVSLIHNSTSIPMTEGPPGIWTATTSCEEGDLAVQYTLTEGGEAETFLVPVGGIALIDPQGVIYELAKYEIAIAAGKTPDQARAEAAISGAIVRLQRKGADGVFRNVLSGDPGITPNVNPQTTGANGRFQWDVSDGVYRVVVTTAAFGTVTSREVTIPPPVLDLHVALGPAAPAPPPPPVVPPPPAPVVRPPQVVRCVVPNVKGKTVAQARRTLASKRCALGRVSRAYSAKVKKSRIISQSRRPGLRLPRGTRVNVRVSRGRRR